MPLPITDEKKVRLTRQVFSLYAQYGFDGISMDEVARRTKISKATLYKYFKSKEEIVRAMVGEITAHMSSLPFTADHGIEGVLESVSTIYSKGILVAAYSSSKFLTDLQNKFPGLYAGFILALDALQSRFTAFYECAVEKGYCKKLCFHLVGEQFKNMLPTIMNPDYLRKHGMTLAEAVREYYKLLLYQILNEAYLAVTDQESTYSFLEGLVEILDNVLLVP